MRKSTAGCAKLIVLTLALVLVLAAQAPAGGRVGVSLSRQWVSVPLPDMPLGLTVHDGDFWVCGANEMIARSTDGGKTWRVLHERQGGQMLFSVVFWPDHRIEAFGTLGQRLISQNGGATWVSHARGHTLLHVQLAGAATAYAAGASGFGVTHDGGRHWRFNFSKPFDPIESQMAVLDADHAAILLEPNDSEERPHHRRAKRAVDEGPLLITSDGGLHWKGFPRPHQSSWGGLRLIPNGYQVYGGGMVLAANALQPVVTDYLVAGGWQAPARAIAPVRSCNRQGCLVRGGWEDTRGSKAVFWKLPEDADEPLTAAWAVAGDTFCRVSTTVRCRKGQEAMAAPQTEATPAHSQLPHILHSASPQYPLADRSHHREGRVQSLTRLGVDGRLHGVVVLSAPSAGLGAAAIRAVGQWRFQPAMRNGKQVAVTIKITVNFHLE